jgi:hypothetical protein
VRARNGIEWFLEAGNPNNYGHADQENEDEIDALTAQQFTLTDYTFDQNVAELQSLAERNKQTSTDPLVHRAIRRYFKANVTVMYDPGANQTATDTAIKAALRRYFNSLYFGAAIQLSDVLAVIHGVPGVDNVRWTYDTDSNVDRIEEVRVDGTATGDVFNADFILQDSELAFSPDNDDEVAAIVRRASNTWTAA